MFSPQKVSFWGYRHCWGLQLDSCHGMANRYCCVITITIIFITGSAGTAV